MKEYFYISGNTYPLKEQLKNIGCKWDPLVKSWYAEDKFIASHARLLVENNEPQRRNSVSKYAMKTHRSMKRKGRMG